MLHLNGAPTEAISATRVAAATTARTGPFLNCFISNPPTFAVLRC